VLLRKEAPAFLLPYPLHWALRRHRFDLRLEKEPDKSSAPRRMSGETAEPANQSHAGVEREPFSALMERRAPAEEFINWLRASNPQPKELSAADWQEQILPVLRAVGDFGWMTDSDRNWVHNCILHSAVGAFTELWKPYSSVPEVLGGFMTWIESLPDEPVVQFCWDLLAYDRGWTPDPVSGLSDPGASAERFPTTVSVWPYRWRTRLTPCTGGKRNVGTERIGPGIVSPTFNCLTMQATW